MTLSAGEVLAGKYRIESVLGAGGMGTVYVATNERLWKKVALKVLPEEVAASPDLAARFAKEAVAASSVKHPGIVEIYDADVHEGVPWIAMELLEGESLGARLARGPMSATEAVGVACEALEALSAVHRAGIVHRDLKPDNLFLERLPGGGQRVKILDFGIAKILDPQMGSQTQTGVAMGTPSFLAPEQASSTKDVDARADLYGVGAILFHALSGALPYEATTFGELVRQMYTSGPRPLAGVAPEVPPALAELVDRCLSADPARRPRSAEELASLLEGALDAPGGMPRTVALDGAALKAQLAAGGAPAPGPGWHPAPQDAAPVAPSAGFGTPPKGPSGVAPTAAMQPKRSGVGVAVLVIGLLIGVMGLVAVAGIGAGVAVYFAARSVEPPEVYPYEEYDPSVVPDPEQLGVAAADAERVRVDVADTMPQRGPDDAVVTIVMFSDYQCPFCSRVEPTITRLVEAHPNDVRVVWRDHPLPFHQDAMPAAELAREAYAQRGDAGFWRMHDRLFENQRALGRAELEGYARDEGLDLARVRAALDGQRHRAAIQADMAVASRAGARGTPGFFLNGRQLMGAQPYERFDEVVREEIAVANALIARGVPRARVYEHLMRDAVDSASQEERPRPSARRTPDPNAIYRVPLGDAPQLGRADALVTIVVVSEFQCPFCNRVRPTLDQVRERYGDDVRIVFKHNPLPFHTNAMPAAEAAVEVYERRGADGFWRFHDTLFENQRELEEANLRRWASELGVNVGPALADHRHRATIEADQELARSLGASGTPSFFINGRNLRGAQPFPAFQAVIDEELARARRLVAAGTPRAELYEALTRDGATSAQFVGEDR